MYISYIDLFIYFYYTYKFTVLTFLTCYNDEILCYDVTSFVRDLLGINNIKYLSRLQK